VLSKINNQVAGGEARTLYRIVAIFAKTKKIDKCALVSINLKKREKYRNRLYLQTFLGKLCTKKVVCTLPARSEYEELL
jgi:hypothetical protein